MSHGVYEEVEGGFDGHNSTYLSPPLPPYRPYIEAANQKATVVLCPYKMSFFH